MIQAVIPDVMVRPGPDGGWHVELNTGHAAEGAGQPDLLRHSSPEAATTATRRILADCLQTANWLVKSLDQRARTILKVASEIVRQQDAFLAEGVQHLRPLNLKTVAEAIGMHESTVSRVTSNKYMATPRGIFEMKYFFTASIASAEGGEAHSAEAVRYRIRRLIDDEPANGDPLRRCHRQGAARFGHRHRPAHGRQVSRSDAHSLLGSAPARKTGGRSPIRDGAGTRVGLQHRQAPFGVG